MAGGRPNKWTAKEKAEAKEEFCALLSSDHTVQQICKKRRTKNFPYNMPCEKTIYLWFREDDEFLQDYKAALEHRGFLHGERVAKIADMMVDPKNEITPAAAGVAAKALMWSASKCNPKQYGDKQQIEANINMNLNSTLNSIPDEDDE